MGITEADSKGHEIDGSGCASVERITGKPSGKRTRLCRMEPMNIVTGCTKDKGPGRRGAVQL